MKMNKKYQIFISSTYKDLIEEREKVIKTILKMYNFPIGMEMFQADDDKQWVQIKNTIDHSDYYILILGRCCGTLIDDENISYTEKEYNYALKKEIPILRFVISDKAKKEDYVETIKQQRAYRKFYNKVLKYPCDFWTNSDELAMLVATALSEKIKNGNRLGWIRGNSLINLYDHNDIRLHMIYDVYYCGGFKQDKPNIINSRLELKNNGEAFFYNNLKNDEFTCEYSYAGRYFFDQNLIYVYLKNLDSNEHATMILMKSASNFQRLIGMFLALSPNLIPVCVKISCFNNIDKKDINLKLLTDILMSENENWNNQIFTIEEKTQYLFFSDNIYK